MMVDPHRQAPMQKRINAILGELIAQRQLLESSPVDRTLLASNGASIAYWQSKLREAAGAAPEPSRPTATLVIAEKQAARQRSQSPSPSSWPQLGAKTGP